MWFLQSPIVFFFIQSGIDLIAPFRKSEKGNVYLCTLTDYFTKWAEGVPIPDKRWALDRNLHVLTGYFEYFSGDAPNAMVI